MVLQAVKKNQSEAVNNCKAVNKNWH